MKQPVDTGMIFLGADVEGDEGCSEVTLKADHACVLLVFCKKRSG